MSVPLGNNPVYTRSSHKRGPVLVVQDDTNVHASLVVQLINSGFDVLVCSSGSEAIRLLEGAMVDMAFIKSRLQDMESADLVKFVKTRSKDNVLPVVILVSESDDEVMRDCMAAGSDEFLRFDHTPAELESCVAAMKQLRELRHQYEESIHEQIVAKQILSAALNARSVDVPEMRVLSRSAGVFSGDLLLTASGRDGVLNIMLADFTGHGLSAAIGVLPVADMFSVMTEKGLDPEVILKNINSKLHTLLPTGMYMAACMVQININLRTAYVLNCGMPDVYLLRGATGEVTRCVKSSHIPLGINQKLGDRLAFDLFDVEEADQIILHSDGLTDSFDVSGNMFGTGALLRLIDGQTGKGLFESIVEAFEHFCMGQKISDDVTLVTIPCGQNLDHFLQTNTNDALYQPENGSNGWRFKIELSGTSLRDIDPLPMIMDQYKQLESRPVDAKTLQSVLAALYENALNHGVLELSHLIGKSRNDDEFRRERERRFGQITCGFVRIEVQQMLYRGKPSLMICLEDSGRGFDHLSYTDGIREAGPAMQQGGIDTVKDHCRSIQYLGSGNRVEVIIGGVEHEDAGA